MRVIFQSGSAGWLLAGAVTVLITAGMAVGAAAVEARPAGVTVPGLWQGEGCFCHGEPYPGTVILSSAIEAPPTVTAGTTVSVTLSLTGTSDQQGPLGLGGGFNLSASRGLLAPGPTARYVADSMELTHLTRTATSWTVHWTAPPTNGPAQLTAALLLANGDGKTSFDSWTIISRTVQVVGGVELRFVPVAALAAVP
ncbi:MAG: choice-of-anchor V domain-containing protein [Chloroflexota bacterium]|nr:hypothetical protein [Dehalococcoidia bacterium]MDW8252783.1 choice-of-anchor V domain-containing protein [Chloroflexota bacterium]